MRGNRDSTASSGAFLRPASVGRARLTWLSIALSVILLVAWSPFRMGVVAGESMTPTLKPHQLFLMDRRYYRTHLPRADDVVVFRQKEHVYIKRIAGAPSDTLWLFEYLDSARRPTYTMIVYPDEMTGARSLADRFPAYCRLHSMRIPDGKLYVIGDAWNISVDSRSFGLIGVDQLMGKVLTPRAPRPERRCWQNVGDDLDHARPRTTASRSR